MSQPIIVKGKSDKYYLCSCGTNASIQYSNCPSCDKVNPNQQSL